MSSTHPLPFLGDFRGDPTENTAYSRSILTELIVRDAIVPEIWAFEIANNIFVSHRKRMRINEQQIAEYLSLRDVKLAGKRRKDIAMLRELILLLVDCNS